MNKQDQIFALKMQIEEIQLSHLEEIKNLKGAHKTVVDILQDQIKWFREEIEAGREKEEVYDISHLAEDNEERKLNETQMFANRAYSWIQGVVPKEEKFPEEELNGL